MMLSHNSVVINLVPLHRSWKTPKFRKSIIVAFFLNFNSCGGKSVISTEFKKFWCKSKCSILLVFYWIITMLNFMCSRELWYYIIVYCASLLSKHRSIFHSFIVFIRYIVFKISEIPDGKISWGNSISPIEFTVNLHFRDSWNTQQIPFALYPGVCSHSTMII